ncbi:MAG: DEAD/DEAH box helicase [Lautropia sp.]|nr:DEAD/DEAH box helicase [Lautropia sp.]
MTLSISDAPEGAERNETPPASDQPASPTEVAGQTVTFSDFGLHPDIMRAIEAAGYVHPTPIQAAAIPVVMTGRDVMAAAQTGTGKTAGFSLPIINTLMPLANTSASPARHPVRALIIAPTRELADQIHDNVKAYSRFTPLRSAAVFGGVDMQPQIDALRMGVEILIATPGRLLDHVQQKSVNLSQVRLLVLDEADRMLDMGFLPDIQRIINLLATKRQNLMFSATFSDEIRKLAKRFLNDPQLIEVARRNSLAENIEQTVYRVESDDLKRDAVAWLIRERAIEQVIVFSNTKIGAGRLARQLQKEGLLAEAIHGDKSQQERLQTLDGFKAGTIKVLVATDVAARGLDIAELPAVINYDLPHSPEDYVHRIGRTGRAGASGMALSLMTDRDQKVLAEIEKLTKRSLKVEQLSTSVISAGRRAERGERPGRGDRGGSRSAESRHRGARQAAKSLPDDPLFHSPYVPSSAPAPAAEDAQPATRNAGLSRVPGRAPRKLAVLLGGRPGG